MEYRVAFEEELSLFHGENFTEFTTRAFDKVPLFQINDDDVEYIKRVVGIIRALCGVLDLDDLPTDLCTAAALLHPVCKYDEVDGERQYDSLHMLHVRGYLAEFQNYVGRDNYNNVMLLIESQAGSHAPIPQVIQSVEDPAHMWILPFAIKLAGGDYGAINTTTYT